MALKPNPVNWFEIPVNDLSRATKFYETILGTELSLNEMGPMKMAWFPMEREGSGAGGTLIKAEHYTPSQSGTLIYFSVDSIEDVYNRVDKNGGKTISPKQSIGEHGFIAIFQDSEGNRIGLHSMK
jgi:predicted enzyme related to lactoylglutathione lyase